MGIDLRDRRFLDIVDESRELEVLSEQFQFTEGPVWHPRERHLTFSDIPADRLYRWREGGGVSIHREPSHMANGNTLDRQARLLTCEHATSRVTREEDGRIQVLASRFEGKELNSPNDIVVGEDGSIYFTDPAYGRTGMHGVERRQELDFQGVYRLDPTTLALTLLTRELATPNGLCFGLDQETLFVADTSRRHIRRFRLRGGSLTGGDVFAESPAPDGLKIDARGNLYAGGPRGVYVYDGASGTPLGAILTPAFCANFTWGGDDLMTLYLTASSGLYRLPVKVPGRPLL